MLSNMKYDLFCKIIIIETFIIEYLIEIKYNKDHKKNNLADYLKDKNNIGN